MQHLARVSGVRGGSGLQERVLAANPLLEAFGNAQTVRNSNSSRFGKYVSMLFGERDELCAAEVRTYLLEKSRIAIVPVGERCYHIFHQLSAACVGRNPLMEALEISEGALAQLSHGGHQEDIAGWEKTVGAMLGMEMEYDEVISVVGIVAAVMLLRGVVFEEVDDGKGTCVKQESKMCCEDASRLLGWDGHEMGGGDALETALCTKSVLANAGKEKIALRLCVSQAQSARDSLIKMSYTLLFDWLVARINRTLVQQNRTDEASGGVHHTRTSISILDIFGFESFEKNSLEQLSINYANERLQQHFTAHALKGEQEEYVKEGITWSRVEYTDNAACLSLLEDK